MFVLELDIGDEVMKYSSYVMDQSSVVVDRTSNAIERERTYKVNTLTFK